MLVEFMRASEHREDEDGVLHPIPISINSDYVAAIFPHTSAPNSVIIRLSDGRGFAVQAPYAEVVEKVHTAQARCVASD